MTDIMTIAEQYLLPAALWLVMFSMGVGLMPRDFARIVENSRAFLVGVGSMLLLVPLFGTALAVGFAPTPALMMGFILLATCPGGILSNLLTDLARGNVALSVSMSLFVSVVYIFTLPFITYFGLDFVFGEGQSITIPVGESISKIVTITVFPVATGMLCRKLLPAFALRIEPLVKTLSTSVLVVVFGMIVVQQWETLKQSFGIVLAIVLAMNICNLGIAFLACHLARIGRRERIAIGMEHIVRQEATAIFVAVTLLGRNDMSLPMIINTFIGMAVGIPFVTWLRARSARLGAADDAVLPDAINRS